MLKYLGDVVALCNVAIEHTSDEINAFVANGKWNSQISIHDFIDTVKGILLVDDGVKQNA